MKNPGALRERITLQSLDVATENSNRSPSASSTYSDIATVGAEVDEDGGQEDISAGRDVTEQRVTFTVRARGDIQETVQVQWDSFENRLYEVTGIKAVDMRRRYYKIRTKYTGQKN